MEDAKLTGRRKRWLKPLLGIAVVAVALCLILAARLGQWLLIDEPLHHAQGIAVLGGGQGWRSIEAASLYRAGWASEVWLTRGAPNETEAELAAIGFPPETESQFSRQVLLKLGVPDSAIRDVPQPVNNTLAELRAIAAYARQRPSEPVIIVTSKYHTRRVRVIWNAIVPGQPAIVRYKPSDPFDPARWWRTSSDALMTVKETFGILNAWAGFPIAPREP